MQETINPTKETLFFLYGSLREGLHNHSIIKNHSELISKTAVINGFELYTLGSYPCVIPTQKKDNVVIGEIYKINDDDVIKRVHLMEIHSGYKLVETLALDLISNKPINVFVYEYKNTNLNPKDKIESGDWVKEFNRKYCKYCGGEIEKDCLKDIHKKCEMYAKEKGF